MALQQPSSAAGRPGRAEAPPGAGLRVATYNVHGCVGLDGRLDPGRIAAVLAEIDADVVGLQEVDSRPAGAQGGDQFVALPRATGMAAVEGPVVFEIGGRYGNALLTRLPLLGVRRLDLSQPGREPRGAIEARLDAGGGRRLRVVTTHLGLAVAERTRQAARLLAALVEPYDGDTVLLGDFNEWHPLSPRLRAVARRFGRAPAPGTFPSWLPVLALDRIWASPGVGLVRVAAHRSALARRASDHLPAFADLHLTARPEREEGRPPLDGPPQGPISSVDRAGRAAESTLGSIDAGVK